MTKAGMLQFLKSNIDTLHILPIYVLHTENFLKNRKQEITNILNEFKDTTVIVRSSSVNEDTAETSNAGKFNSILNVNLNAEELESAIEKVYQSYSDRKNEEILIQPMMKDIIKTGVVFTVDNYTFAPYYIMNYNEGNDSEAVTSGKTNMLKTYVSYKNSPFPIEDKDMNNVIAICKTIEEFLQETALDMEFGINAIHEVYIFQVRPIAKGNKGKYFSQLLDGPLNKIYKKVEKLNRPHPFLLGSKSCFGVMPDWNPAEILGIRPKRLSITLYKELITDEIWAHQREDYGYRDLTMHPLMVSLCGIPYIDTRITFNSFVPASLNEEIAEKLIDYYSNQLSDYPVYHDKIEFEIVYSCYYLNLPEKLKKLLNFGFNENEIKRIEFSLLTLTNKIVHPKFGLYKKDIIKINQLEANYDKIINADISKIDQIYWLIEECKTYGTLPFAGVARAGFIATQFLQSFVDLNIIAKDERSKFMNTMNTVNIQMTKDYNDVLIGKIGKDKFLAKYGHIRPGTYDILSQRYDENFEYYFSDVPIHENKKAEEYRFTDYQLEQIQVELEQNGLEITAVELLIFIKEAIEGREYLKFVFTKSVSKILQLIEELGNRLSISKEELAHLDISLIKQLYVDLYYDDLKTIFIENIEKNKKQYECAQVIKLPSIIIHPKDIYNYFLLEEEPNFVTLEQVEGEVVLEEAINYMNVEGKIVFIQAADPGYDFLFSKQIGGLVTQFGGANSHMAIRCAELQIPAVIGAGEKKYWEWKKANCLQIDCAKKKVSLIR